MKKYFDDDKSPSEVYNLPVIGRIKVQLKGTWNGVPFEDPVDEYDVILIKDHDNGSKTYVCNQWNSPGVVQLVPDICVIHFEEK